MAETNLAVNKTILQLSDTYWQISLLIAALLLLSTLLSLAWAVDAYELEMARSRANSLFSFSFFVLPMGLTIATGYFINKVRLALKFSL